MNDTLACIPCLCTEAVAALQEATADPGLRAAVLGEALFHLAMRDPEAPPETWAEDLRALISSRTRQPIPPLTTQRSCPRGAPRA